RYCVHLSLLCTIVCSCFMCTPPPFSPCFFFNASATTEIYTLSLHDALPISKKQSLGFPGSRIRLCRRYGPCNRHNPKFRPDRFRDRKSTRLNSSHVKISYAVFCLKKKKDTDCRNRYSVATITSARRVTKDGR